MRSILNGKKVSIIIPTYNRGRSLPRAVESIVKQQYDNIEIIIVDDGSTDNTNSILKTLANKFPFIVYCKNHRSKGPSGARNTGILRSTGDYLAFLDSDDVWLEDHLQNGISILESNQNVDVLFGNYKAIDEQTGHHLYNFFDQKKVLFSLKSIPIGPDINLLSDNLFAALIKENFFHLGTSIVRKSVLEGILMDESVRFAEDRDFAIKLYKEGNASFAYREQPFYIAYRHDSNLTKKGDLIGTHERLVALVSLYTRYLATYDLSDAEKTNLIELISEILLKRSYVCRKKNQYYHAFINIIESAKYRFSFRHIIELAKVVINRISYFFFRG